MAKRQYKIKNKETFECVYMAILKSTNFKSARLIFPFVDLDAIKGHRVYGHAEVSLNIKFYKK